MFKKVKKGFHNLKKNRQTFILKKEKKEQHGNTRYKKPKG